MTSGNRRTREWKLTFERRTAPFVEPLMGWTAGDDPMVQVELSFRTFGAAVGFAERQGLTYRVDGNPRRSDGRVFGKPCLLRAANPSYHAEP
jgi:hypothetical protein